MNKDLSHIMNPKQIALTLGAEQHLLLGTTSSSK